MTIHEMGAQAKIASRGLRVAGETKTKALLQGAKALVEHEEEILDANALDIRDGKAAGMTEAFQDRLRLTGERIRSMAQAMEEVARASDPVGRVLSGEVHKNGMEIEKITVPLGVIGIIYEARPNVTADAAALCIKSGNAVILRGGKEALRSNLAVAKVLQAAFTQAGLPENSLQLVENPSRDSARQLMELTEYLDVLIPRGGGGLIRSVKENAKVPVIETGVGNCHIYVDSIVCPTMAAELVYNGKTSRPSVCNALETLLVHEEIAPVVLPMIAQRLQEKNVELRGCEKTRKILPQAVAATEEDWAEEFLDYILAVKVVSGMDEAIAHIEKYSSGHSECIVTEAYGAAREFTARVDSAAVYVNASTRFTDGGEFGLGAEIGISTQKLHARGPMGLQELVSYKYVVRGTGQVR